MWPKKTVLRSWRHQTRKGLCVARKEVCPGCGQKPAQLPPRCLLGLCQHAREEAAGHTWQLPRETAKRTPGHPSVPTSSIPVSHLTASLTSETFMGHVFPTSHHSCGQHPGLSQRDGEGSTKPPAGPAALAAQRSEQAG